MLVYGGLPPELLALDVVDCGDLQSLTLTNARHVARLVDVMRTDAMLRNPLLVTETADRLVVLDGNARLAAANQIGLPHIMVQRIPLRELAHQIELPAWAIAGIGREEILRVMEPGFGPPPDDLRGALQLFTADGVHRALSPLPEAPTVLWQAYRRMITALQSITDLAAVRGWSPERTATWPDEVMAVVVPPTLDLETLEELVREQIRLPWGALQAPLPRRILGINLSLKVLAAGEPAREKSAFVRELVRLRLAERRIHYYDAPVYIVED